MGMVDFSRGELSPKMRFRSDLETYYKGVMTLENFLPKPQSGLVRRPGTQVLGIKEKQDTHIAVRTFNLGATGLSEDIAAPGTGLTISIGENGIYTTDDRVFDLKKNTEIQILLACMEPDTIEAYWLNTPNDVPAYIQTLWNYAGGYQKPVLGFDDVRDIRVVQIESSVYFVAQNKIYRLYWDPNKDQNSSLAWNASSTYAVGDVVKYTYTAGVDTFTHWLECIKAHDSSTLTPQDGDGSLYWKIVYEPHLSWLEVPVRVGRKLLEGTGTDYDPYEYLVSYAWADGYQYCPGDVVEVGGTYYECTALYTGTTPKEATPPGTHWRSLTAVNSLTDDDKVYQRHAVAYREETIPREIVAHQGRLLMSSSALYPATAFGSEISHYANFGAGPYDDDPWIFTISGDRVGRILWMYVTDQLYFGTRGGVFGVSDVITPNQFLLRKITTHSASEVEGVAAAGNLLYFQGDRQTLREIKAIDAQQNYEASDLTIFSSHLFETHKAVKMVVQHSPDCVVWILREDGILVSLSYEYTTGMLAFARHTFPHPIIDITGGTGDDLYMAAEGEEAAYLMRLGRFTMTDSEHTNQEIHVDGQIRLVITDTATEFATYIKNKDFRDWMEAHNITSVPEMNIRTLAVDASGQSISGLIKECGLRYFTALQSLNLSNNQLSEWRTIPIPASWVTIDFSDNSLSVEDVNQILSDLLYSVTATPRTGTIDLSGNAAATYDGMVAGVALRDAGWTVSLENAGNWWEGHDLMYSGNGNTGGTAPDTAAYLEGEQITIAAKGDLVKSGADEWDPFGANMDESPHHITDPEGTGLAPGMIIPVAGGVAEGHYVDSYGQRFTPSFQYGALLRAKPWTEGHKYYLYTLVKSDSANSYLQVTDNAGQYPNDFHSGTGVFEYLGVEITAGAGSTYGTYSVCSNLAAGFSEIIWAGSILIDITLMYPEGGESSLEEFKNFLPDQAYSQVDNNFEFMGWNTQADGYGETYAPNQIMVIGGEDITLYAKWLIWHTIKFFGNGNDGGVVPGTLEFHTNEQVTVPLAEPSLQLFDFAGWNTKPDRSGESYSVGQSFPMPSHDLELYAQWDTHVYAIGEAGPAGGWIFYDKGSYSDGWRFLECAPAGWNPAGGGDDDYQQEYRHAIYLDENTGGYLDTSIGAGYANTSYIVEHSRTAENGAISSWDLVLNGYSDWFLPSLNELQAMYDNLRLNGWGDFELTGYRYLSSSVYRWDQYDESYSINFANGYVTDQQAELAYFKVRPIRKF